MAVLRRGESMTTLPLSQLARVVRSKNAGPLCLTIDLFFPDQPSFERARDSQALSRSAVAALYGLDTAQVLRFDLEAIKAIKLSMPRRLCAGDPGDGDVYGAQQHAPLLDLQL
jgi:hypothetical protein